MTARLCSRCGAPLTHAAPGEALTCHFCGAEDQGDPAPPPAQPVAPAPSDEKPYEPVYGSGRKGSRSSAGWTIFIGVVAVAGMAAGVIATVVKAPHADEPTPASTSAEATGRPASTTPAPAATIAEAGLAPDTIATSVTLALSGPFVEPRYVAVDGKGAVFVAEKDGRVQGFDASGKPAATWRAETTNQPHGSKSTDIATSQGLAVDRKGRVWLSFGYDVLVFDGATGKQVLKVPHHFPATCFRDISVDPAGSMLVRSACTDRDVYAYVRLDASGNTLATFPQSAAWQTDADNRAAIDAAGHVYEPHTIENQVVVVDAHFKPLDRFGSQGDALGFFHHWAPGAMVLDGQGRLFVVDDHDIDVYDTQGHPKGRLQRQWPEYPEDTRDIALAPDGQLWVLHTKGAVRVKVGT